MVGTEVVGRRGDTSETHELAVQVGVNGPYSVLVDEAARDGRLVRDHDEQEAGSGQIAKGLGHAGQDAEIAGMRQRVEVGHEDAVPVEKDGSPPTGGRWCWTAHEHG